MSYGTDSAFQNPTAKQLTTGAAANVTAGAATLLSVDINNGTGADAFVQLFDVAAASVILGTTVPVMSFAVEASASINVQLQSPKRFLTRISCGSTTTRTGLTTAACSVEFQFIGSAA